MDDVDAPIVDPESDNRGESAVQADDDPRLAVDDFDDEREAGVGERVHQDPGDTLRSVDGS